MKKARFLEKIKVSLPFISCGFYTSYLTSELQFSYLQHGVTSSCGFIGE